MQVRVSSRAIVTGCVGDSWRSLSKITHPRMNLYAKKHGCDFISDSEGWDAGSRPLSWMKLLSISRAMASYEEVLWLDSDVLVVDGENSIFDGVPSSFAHAAVLLECPSRGPHVNLGVWLLRKHACPMLVEAAMMDKHIHDQWWEQAAVNEIVNSGRYPTFSLDKSWNTWTDSPGRFYHSCKSQDVNEKITDLMRRL